MGTIYETNPNTGNARAILVGANLSMSEERFQRSITELKDLAEACNLEVVGTVTQLVQSADHGTLIGSGKIEEIKNEIYVKDADIIVFSETLSPLQIRNLEKAFDTEVIDRTGLILQIFSSRARTRESKLQVESAQLQYMLPRLAGMRAELSRQGGGGQHRHPSGLPPRDCGGRGHPHAAAEQPPAPRAHQYLRAGGQRAAQRL